jgi:chromosome segregation ATPase
MADNISAKIKLEGETEFKRAVNSANKEMKAMNSELKQMTSEAKAQGKSLKDMANYQDQMTKATKAASDKVTAYANGLANARQQQEKIASQLADYGRKLDDAQKKLLALKTSGSATDEELKNQQKVVKDLQATIDAGNKTYQDATDRVNTWRQGLADAKREETDLKNTTEGTADAQKDLNEAVGQIEKWRAFAEVVSTSTRH